MVQVKYRGWPKLIYSLKIRTINRRLENEETTGTEDHDRVADIDSISESQESGENKGSLLWLIVMSFGFTLLFTAFQTGIGSKRL